MQPEIKWFSGSDVSSPVLGLKCFRVEDPPAGTSPTAWYRFWKILVNMGDPIPF